MWDWSKDLDEHAGGGGGKSNIDTELVSPVSGKVGASLSVVEWKDWLIYRGGGKVEVREWALV